jgi:hypothetical protein
MGGALNMEPTDYDWSDHPCGEEWESWEANDCPECSISVAGQSGCEQQHSEADETVTCEGMVNFGDGPMMSYYYELPCSRQSDPIEMALAISHLPLCVVRFISMSGNNEFALALTGGGMDFSWQICEAYMQLGYLPPLHFCGLQDMCQHWNSKVQWILAGCEESYRVAARNIGSGKYRIKQLRQKIKNKVK